MYFNGELLFRIRDDFHGQCDFTEATNSSTIDKAESRMIQQGINFEVLSIAPNVIKVLIKANTKSEYEKAVKQFGHWCAESGMRKYVSSDHRLFDYT
jgi:hypothetical protein